MRESFFFFEKIIWKDSKLTAVAPTLADKKYPCCSVAGSLTTGMVGLSPLAVADRHQTSFEYCNKSKKGMDLFRARIGLQHNSTYLCF